MADLQLVSLFAVKLWATHGDLIAGTGGPRPRLQPEAGRSRSVSLSAFIIPASNTQQLPDAEHRDIISQPPCPKKPAQLRGAGRSWKGPSCCWGFWELRAAGAGTPR